MWINSSVMLKLNSRTHVWLQCLYVCVLFSYYLSEGHVRHSPERWRSSSVTTEALQPCRALDFSVCCNRMHSCDFINSTQSTKSVSHPQTCCSAPSPACVSACSSLICLVWMFCTWIPPFTCSHLVYLIPMFPQSCASSSLVQHILLDTLIMFWTSSVELLGHSLQASPSWMCLLSLS